MNRNYFRVILCMLLLAVFVWLPVEARAESTLTSSEALVDFIKAYEGFASKPVWDHGQWTVGYGTRCPDDKLAEYQANGIPQEDAEQLLKDFLVSFESEVNKFVDKYELTLEQHQFDALVSFTYNCGGSWTRETTGYFHKAVVSGDTGNDFLYGISLWGSASGEFILMDRRMSEANMYINGVYEKDTYPDNFRWVFLDANGGAVQYKVFGFDANTSQSLNVTLTSLPADANGNAYTFAGWYTAAGTKVENLNSSVARGETLFARWLDKNGSVVQPTVGEPENLQITVIGSEVNIRSGPGTHYAKVGTGSRGDVLTLTEVVTGGTYTWGNTDKGWIALEYTNYEGVKNGGWYQENGKWAYYQNGKKLTNVWKKDSVGWCYLGSDGYMVTNSWQKDSVGWCYLGADGRMVTNSWARDSVGWCYLGSDGRMVTNRWVRDSVGWCYLGADGYMVTNRWQKDSVGWCYLGSDGRMVTNGWARDSVGWCYLNAKGYMVVSDWVKWKGSWYYMDANGYMVSGCWKVIGGYEYYFYASGIMAADTRIGGYYVNVEGQYVPGK